MALARLESIEALRYDAPGEGPNSLGLDRVSEIRTLRAKVQCDLVSMTAWKTQLPKEYLR